MLTYAKGVALVTGGSGGIGSAVVKTLAQVGIPVAMTYRRNREAAEAVAREKTGGVPIEAYAWSSAGAEEASELVTRVSREVGPIRYLVSCAGIAQTSAFHVLSEKEWRDLIETNLIGNIALARAVVTLMLKAGFGRILFTGSVSGLRGLKGHTVYAATKAALHGMTRSLAQECAAFNVTVNSIAPGYIATSMLDDLPEEARKSLEKTIPMGRFGDPQDVAHIVAFLASEQASYVTGQTWAVDGGVSG